jgi:hypothetical protein
MLAHGSGQKCPAFLVVRPIDMDLMWIKSYIGQMCVLEHDRSRDGSRSNLLATSATGAVFQALVIGFHALAMGAAGAAGF